MLQITALAITMAMSILSATTQAEVIFNVGNPTCPTSQQEGESITVLTEDGISEIDISIINTAVEVGILTEAEGEWIKGQVAAGNMDIIDNVTDPGIVSFTTITYDDVEEAEKQGNLKLNTTCNNFCVSF